MRILSPKKENVMVRKTTLLFVLSAAVALLSVDRAEARGRRCGRGGCGSSCGSSGHCGGGHCYIGHSGGGHCSSGHCSVAPGGGHCVGGHCSILTAPAAHHAALPAPATVVVSLPADARLSIDGYQTNSTSSQRTFQSPSLAADQVYYYTLKAEVVRDGKTHSAEKRVQVQAGKESRVQIDIPVAVADAR